MVAKTIIRKKNLEIVKEEFINLLRENDTVEKQEFNIQNIVGEIEAIDIIMHYEGNMKTGNK